MSHLRTTRSLFPALVLSLVAALALPQEALAKAPARSAPASHPGAAKTARVDGASREHGGHPREALGKSMGSPTEGHLVDGVRLDEGPAIRIAPVYASGDVRYGTRHLVHLVDRASRQVRHKFPDAVLSVGHLSRRGGGELDRHASHESGRDADLGFYVASAAGKPLYAPAFVPFAGDGKAKAWPGAHFDDAKNWALVEALLTDPEAHVTHIFVAQPLRERLLAYAQRMGVRDAVRVRASETMAQPKGALPHDDHFHVRIACPKNADGCVENPARRVARAVKGHGHGTTHGREVHAAKGAPAHKPAGHASQPARPAHEAAKAKPTPPPASTHEDTSKKTSSDDHADVPHLGPFVPGLDSVVIPAPMDDVDGN